MKKKEQPSTAFKKEIWILLHVLTMPIVGGTRGLTTYNDLQIKLHLQQNTWRCY